MKWHGARQSVNIEDIRTASIYVGWVDTMDNISAIIDLSQLLSGEIIFYRDGYVGGSPSGSKNLSLMFERWGDQTGVYSVSNRLSDGQIASLRAFLKPYQHYSKITVDGDDGALVEKIRAILSNTRG